MYVKYTSPMDGMSISWIQKVLWNGDTWDSAFAQGTHPTCRGPRHVFCCCESVAFFLLGLVDLSWGGVGVQVSWRCTHSEGISPSLDDHFPMLNGPSKGSQLCVYVGVLRTNQVGDSLKRPLISWWFQTFVFFSPTWRLI